MNVLVISHLFPNPYVPSYGTFVREQLEALKRYQVAGDVDVFIALYTDEGKRLIQNELQEDYCYLDKEKSFNLYYVRGIRSGYPLRISLVIILYRFYLLLRRLNREKQYSLIHAHFAYPDAVMGMILSRLFSIPMVTTCHGSDIFQLTRKVSTRMLIRMALRRSKRIFCVSKALADKVRSLGVESDRLAVVCNGIDLSVFHPTNKESARHKTGLPMDHRALMYVGNLKESKGVLDLLKAFILVRGKREDLQLVFIGDGPCRKDMMDFIDENGLGSSVSLVGSQGRDLIPLWMSAADMLVLPSHSEGFGLVLAEALACGTPVIGTDVGGIPEIINSPEVGLLAPSGRVDALGEKIEEALDRKWNSEKLIARSRDFSWEKVAREIEAEYSLVVQKMGISSFFINRLW